MDFDSFYFLAISSHYVIDCKFMLNRWIFN